MQEVGGPQPGGGGELALLLLFVLYGLAMLVLYWVWNYRAYSVSCNVHGSKAVMLYIAALVVGTAVSPGLVGLVIRSADKNRSGGPFQ